MAESDVFRTLPPNIRAFALVGHYLSSFALMEAALNDAVSTALELDDIQQAVLCKNMQLRDKIKIARTMCDLSAAEPETKKSYDKLLNNLSSKSNDRNMVAHDLFGPDEKGDGVHFLVTRASGKLHFPEMRWSIDDVEEKSEELLEIGEQLDALKRVFSRTSLVKALMRAEERETIGGLFQLGALGQGLLQPPSDQGSPPQETTDARSPQTQKEPEEE